MDTRAQLKNLINTVVLTGGRLTTAANIRLLLGELVDAVSNIADDKNFVNGYLGINSAGRVDTSFIKDIVAVDNYLRDDGSWQPVPGENMSEKTIDITSMTNIDLTGVTAHIINLTSSNATETINSLQNFSGLARLEFRPENGLTLTINDASIASGNIHLNAPTLIVYGSQSGFITVATRNSQFYQYIYIDQYV